MVQTCRVLHSRKQWKKKAIKRGAELREMRKTLNRKNEQIESLKATLEPDADKPPPVTELTVMDEGDLKKKT